jgi:hypothetical protein
MFVAQLVVSLRSYTRQQLTQDIVAGAVVGVVALPLAMAFAITSGVPPERGLYTAIVAGFLISALGGSTVPRTSTRRSRAPACSSAAATRPAPSPPGSDPPRCNPQHRSPAPVLHAETPAPGPGAASAP